MVAIRFNAKGVSLSVMSACATGTNSIGEAFHCIKDGYADAIIAGGAEAVGCSSHNCRFPEYESSFNKR